MVQPMCKSLISLYSLGSKKKLTSIRIHCCEKHYFHLFTVRVEGEVSEQAKRLRDQSNITGEGQSL